MKRFILTAAIILGLFTLGACKNDPEIEIREAPIHVVDIRFAESYPVQIFVFIQGGLSDGCTTFKEIKTTRDGTQINIEVLVQRPAKSVCTAIYGYFEENVALGSDFETGKTYTVTVNDVVRTFVMP